MKVAVVGSGSFNDYERMKKVLDFYPITTVVSGGAKGADTLAEKYSREVLGKEPEVYPADWDNLEAEPCDVKINKNGKQYNRLAGFNRNTTIVENSRMVIAFWTGKSPGTKDSLRKAEKMRKTTLIVYF